MKLTNEQILAMCKDRLDGMKVSEIAKKYGISETYAQMMTPRTKERKYKIWYEAYIYPNIAAWMRKTNTAAIDFGKHLGVNQNSFFKAMTGEINLNKPKIDKILALTGMKYEDAFRTKDEICKSKGADKI